ncbi:MAG: M48 family metalloprotease [Rhodocyclaceae bacterium]|nr:M48 family metalloprotease [Rhodocyclaceae bacterium]
MKIKPLLALLVFLAPHAMAEGLPDLGENALTDLSPVMEQKLGASIMRDLRWNDPGYLDDPEVTAYLNRVGDRLAAAIPDGGLRFRFFALRDPTLNAFALPGGYIGVHTALILSTQSESELAGVLAHEISHVTQHHIARMVGKQKEATAISLASLLVAVLAARSNSQVSQAAMAGGAAAGLQNQLNYSRDFEREADRMGLQRLEAAGFDVRGMAIFFERLQRDSRLYENNAPAYLRSHPLTTERISDMEGRVESMPYHQVPDSLEYQLVRAKLRVASGTATEAVADFRSRLQDRKYTSEAAARYGLARALLAAGNAAEAEQERLALSHLKLDSPMLDTLEAEIRLAQKDKPAALAVYRRALLRHPHEKALIVGLAEALIVGNEPVAAVHLVEQELPLTPSDPDLYGLQARAYGALGRRLLQHRAQAELYALQGRLKDAVDQLQLAQRAGDGNFYELSAVDARLRELKAKEREAAKEAKDNKQP